MDLNINFVTENTTRKMNSTQKCDFIISKLKTDCVLVFEGGLNPEEEAKLIEETMDQIDHQDFLGYKILNPTPLRMRDGLFSRKNVRMTVIAPYNYDHLSIALV
ncbi:MAG: OapB/ArvB family protein [Candidatus Hodarchaeales archaeon]